MKFILVNNPQTNSDKQKHLYFQGYFGSWMYISVISGPL